MARSRPAFARPLPLWRPPLPPSLPPCDSTHSLSLSFTYCLSAPSEGSRAGFFATRAGDAQNFP